jgi:hypothetical protein
MAIESDIKAGYVPMMDLKTGKMYTINNSIDPVLEGPFKNVFAKGGQMIKRADGSYSQRGLWDNIRANKGSGKKPTKAMLEQERKIKNKYQGGGKSTIDSVRHQANKILQYEQLRGGPGGAPLPQYSNPKYMDMLMEKVYPEVRKIMPNASAIEAGEAMDFVFNAGFDQSTNKITKDPRAFALQEYYRQNDPSKLDADGKWAGRKNAPYSFDQEYNNTVGKLPENQRRILMNKGRDWYYKNINNPAPGVPNSNYNDTWFGRIWNTNDYQPFNPNNPNFTPKKEKGGEIKNKYQGGGEKITIPFNSLMPNTAVQSSTLVNNNPAKNWLSNLPELAPEVKNYPIKIKDNRKINTVTNAPINPKTDLKSGDYNYIDIKNIVDASNAVGVDPNLALAIALQESNLGKTDLNYGHVTKDFLQNAKTSELQNYNYDALQLAYAINNKIGKKPLNAYNIQAYNGYGKLGVNTEKGISTSGNKSGVKKWYGVDVTKEPLDLKKNPAYGKTILDLYNNVILPNKEIQDIINYKFDFSESKQSGGWLKKYK